MKFTSSEVIMFLIVGFVMGMFLMASIQYFENEWGDIDWWFENLRGKKMKKVCNNCEKKGCGAYHDICPDYQEFKNKIKKANEIRQKESLTTSYEVDRTWATKKALKGTKQSK